MVMWKSDTTFRGIKEKKLFKANEPFEMTIDRAEEVQEQLKKKYNLDATFERVDKKDEKDSKGE